MGQPITLPVGVKQSPGERTLLRPVQASYVPLYDVSKVGDSSGIVVTPSSVEDSKDAMDKIIEFSASLCNLPKETQVVKQLQTCSPEQQMKEIMSSVDSVDELFQHISQLAGLPIQVGHDSIRDDIVGKAIPGAFNARVACYVKNLQILYHLTKKEKYRYEQRLLAARARSMTMCKVSPPPLPLPTQNCMTIGWDMVVMLLKATRKSNPTQYENALQMVKENLKPIKPTAYSDSMYLAPSASSAFNLLSKCLGDLAHLVTNRASEGEMRAEALTIETLAEVGLARGSLATMLSVVLWLIKQPPKSSINLETTIAKLAELKEQPMYGKCDASGELYSCGQNSYGELGTGDDTERHQLTSVALCGWDDICQVASGNETMAVLTNDGSVLTCGLNKNGQCGHGHFDKRVMMLRPVQTLRSQQVKFIAASNGCEHIIALTDLGLAYSWGCNNRGQLGHGNLATKIHLPKLIESLKDTKLGYASVSYHHSAVVTDSGKLYTFGMNDCGQLGLEHTQLQSIPQLVKSLKGIEVSMAACGLYHTLVCTATGDLFACGKNDYGQLGLAHNRQVNVFSPVALTNETVCFVACGYYHSVVVTTDGQTFSVGRNDYGQLGIGSKVHQNVPNVVAFSAGTRMVRATCGCYHTVLLSDQGQVFVFGRNNKGQLGNRGSADALLPVPLKVRPEKNPRRCVDIAAGFYTTSLIVERNRENDDGDLFMLDQSGVVVICGRVDIDRSGEIEGLSNFGSISTVGVSLFEGTWFYEVEVVTSGLIQVGWIDGYFQGNSDKGKGVGDHAHSWSYDGHRQRRWNSESSSYGEKWRVGDIIGCLLDLTTQTMTYFRNGVNLGVAYSELKYSADDRRSGMMPGISLERGEIIRINLGHQAFAYPPATGYDLKSISRAIAVPSTSVVIHSPGDQLDGLSPHPLPAEGSASALVGNRLFVVGGMLSEGSSFSQRTEVTNQVWVYDVDAKIWERWADFPIGICNHQVVAIDDYHILVLGGESTCATSRHMDLYKCSTLRDVDGSLPAWNLIQASIGAATSMPQARAFHTVSKIHVRLDTIVFMYGGKSVENEILGDSWYLSLDSYAWSRLPGSISLDPGPRAGCSSAAIGECVYIFGGKDRAGRFRSDLWKYSTFDRVWHLCYDDNIGGGSKDAESCLRGSSNKSQLMLPEGRICYSMCADLGNIWIFGGINQTNTYLCDIWYFSTTSQKWNDLETTFQEEINGYCSAALHLRTGAVTALPSIPNSELPAPQSGNLFLFGGCINLQGKVSCCSKVRKMSFPSSTGMYRLHVTKNVSMIGDAVHVVSALRTKAGNRSTQHCAAEALDTAICLLSHLDRLAGNSVPEEDADSVQLSRCLHRSLCIDPNEATFSALYALLDKLMSRFIDLTTFVEDESNTTSSAVHVMYPLLVTIRLLKINFYEFSRSCLDGSAIGLTSASSQCEGHFDLICKLLFMIVNHEPKLPMSGEVVWLYDAVKNESAAAICHGFSALFPSLLDRIQVMNRLMVKKQNLEAKSTPAQELLVPMLVPYFTSAKMLFQLIGDPDVLAKANSSSDTVITEIVIACMDTLLNGLWEKTKNVIDLSPEDFTKLVDDLDDIERNYEFKCFNVLLRATIFWCSRSTNRGWVIIESACMKLVAFISQYLDQCHAMPFEKSQHLLVAIQHSFSGKLLPFVLLSMFSLPSVHDALPALLDPFWSQLEALSTKLHTTFAILSKRSVSYSCNPRVETLSTLKVETDFVDTALASISIELSAYLQQTSGSSVTYNQILKRLWDKIIKSKGYAHWKVKNLVDAEIRRIAIPVDLAKLFGTETLLVKVQKAGTESGLLDYEPGKISFAPSRTILSQHIYPRLSTPGKAETDMGPSSAPQSLAMTHSSVVWCPGETIAKSHEWLKDLQNIIAWVGSHYATNLVIGGSLNTGVAVSERWLQSTLFRGGLEEAWPEAALKDNEVGRNEALLLQVIDNVGNGKKLLDKVRNALDPESGRGNENLQFRAVRLKRKDSVEAILEKSDGIEAVNRAVRATFAALLKHTHVSYTNEPISSKGALAESVINAWKAALQLRRWIVREQQKLAAAFSEAGAPSGFSPNMTAKDRQQVLYNAVCEPIIRRAFLLLQLAPAPIQDAQSASSPIKLLPGISMAKNYDFSNASQDKPSETTFEEHKQKRFARQFEKLMETKSVEVMEEEDEQIHADIFSFLQHSEKPMLLSSPDNKASTRHFDDQMRDILMLHQNRAKYRLRGLTTFVRLLQNIDNLPMSRFHVIPMLSSAFKRVCITGDKRVEKIAAEQMSIVKVHYLTDLEFAGPQLLDAIRREFFQLLTLLLKTTASHFQQVQKLIDTRVDDEKNKTRPSPSSIHLAVHDMLLVLETCCLPYRGQDWNHLQSTNLVSLVTDLTSWKGWQSFIQYNVSRYSPMDRRCTDTYTILPAGTGLKCPKILCSRYVTIGSDLRKLSITHKSFDGSDENLQALGKSQNRGGLAVFDRSFYRGRWYWEVSVRLLGDTPVFVGITPGTADVNTYVSGDCSLYGVLLYHERFMGDITTGIRWNNLNILGVLLDCEQEQLEFYNNGNRCHVVSIASSNPVESSLFPSIGLKDADVHWHLVPSIPPKLWCAASNFRLPQAVVSGGLIAVPFDGASISWNVNRKGSHLQVLPNGMTVCAGDCSLSQDQFETIAASQGFENESIFIEIRVIAAGKHGRSALSFGIVSDDFLDFEGPLREKLDVTWTSAEEVLQWGTIGLLFDFTAATISLYSDRSNLEVCHLNIARLNKPLFPAVSVLCNGTVFDVNFHPRPRLKLPSRVFYPATKPLNHHMSSFNDSQLGKSLQLQVHSCDGGELSSSRVMRHCLVDDATVYSSSKGANVNLVLKHEIDTPMCVSSIQVRGPGLSYSSPLRCAIIFITSTPPDVSCFKEYDGMTAEEFAALPFPPSNGCCSRDETVPVAFFVLNDSCAQISKQIAYPITGRYILVKAVCPSAGTNIDIGYIGFSGIFDRDNGPAYNETMVGFYTCEECKKASIRGVFYARSDDSSIKMCAACYDNNRGDLSSAYYVYTSDESHDGHLEASSLLCPRRRSWNDKVAALCNVSQRLKLPSTVSDENTLATARLQTRIPERPSIVVSYGNCELFSCGQNNYGELCLGHCNSTGKLERVPLFSTKAIHDVAGGNEVLAVVMKDGAVYTCGLNKSGQCGNGTFEERVVIATPVHALRGFAISMIAAANGCEHMLAVSSDGAVYSWGYNDCGQLGLGLTVVKSHTPRMIDSLREKYHVTTAAVSYHHSAVVTSAGELLTFGMNDSGQLGLDHAQHQHTPQLVLSLSNQVITKVACGLYHTVAITVGGAVYSFGKNDYGQLGLGHARDTKVPNRVKMSPGESDEKIVAVSCGYYHTVSISEQGKLITWGRNDYGQLGIGSKDHKYSAQYVPLPLSSRVKSVSCGCYHTLILLSNGRVMAFGRNNKGQLGVGSRTLSSADLPLSILPNSLTNDEVVCIAAGFYSSYILTGSTSESHRLGDTIQAKDRPKTSCVVNSDAFIKLMMKEIDSKRINSLATKREPLQIKHAQPNLLLVKLYATGWAMTRALMYRSLQDANNRTTNRSAVSKSPVNPVLSLFLSFLLENLELLQVNSSSNIRATMTSKAIHELNAIVSWKRVCVGLLQYFGIKYTLPAPISGTLEGITLDSIHGYFYKNQILSVLLACASANTCVGSIIASNSVVTALIISEMSSSDLALATISIRLAMVIFPHHSVSALNKIYRSQQSTPFFSGDVLNMLMKLVGIPLLLRPRLCSHELGLECTSTVLCHSAQCRKGVTMTNDAEIAHLQEVVLEKAHVAEAKAAEVVALLRYLTLYPAWKVAVNGALNRAFSQSNKVHVLLDTVCAYYSSVQKIDGMELQTAVFEEFSGENDASSLRKPEPTTALSETDELISNTSNCNTRTDDLEAKTRDKHSLMLWRKARVALDGLATVLASVSIVGGHVEAFREGGYVTIEKDGTEGSSRLGMLTGITRDPRTGDLLAQVVLESSSEAPVVPFVDENARSQTFALAKLEGVERIPATIDMFNDVEDIIVTLLSMISAISSVEEECATYNDLDLPQNSAVQEVLRNRLKMLKQQLRWRSSKALSSLLKQIPNLSSKFLTMDSQLVSSLVTLLSSENLLSSVSKSELLELENANIFQKRWLCVKQRQIFLDTEEVIDSALDHLEAETRDEVIQKLGSENALSWERNDMQSPRLNASHRSFAGAGSVDFASNGLRIAGEQSEQLSEGDVPFGAWGILLPLPPLDENDQGQAAGSSARSAVSYAPFPLTAPIVRVGRAADACDLIVNDRSVSGSHFHLRRLRREAEGQEEEFELQDFSKNGTIVDGVRIHGSTTRVSTGSRISLILSRGGLITYEFQSRVSIVGNRHVPPAITTAQQSRGDLNILIPGQEYPQPYNITSQAVPRSPAELQNCGTHGGSALLGGPIESRSRHTLTQGLRVIASVPENEAQALLSPNPAVDSPRAGGYNTPRSSMLQTPGTPAIRSPAANTFSTLIPDSTLSPASYQQRESFSPNEAAGIASPRTQDRSFGSMLRIALGRDSVNRESSAQRSSRIPNEVMKTNVRRSSSDISLSSFSNVSPSLQEMKLLALRLLARAQEANLSVSPADCEEALWMTSNNMDEALRLIQGKAGFDTCKYPLSVRHLAMVLGRAEPVCAEALRQTDNNYADALRLLLSSASNELERLVLSSKSCERKTPRDDMMRSRVSAPLVSLQGIGDENPSYTLMESSSMCPPATQPVAARAYGSPAKTKKMVNSGSGGLGKLQTKPDLTLWSESNSSFDDGIRKMNAVEIDIEERILCKRLAAIHARKSLNEIVRLFENTLQSDKLLLSELSDPLLLRPLISLLKAPGQASKSKLWCKSEYQIHGQLGVQKSGKIQLILLRMMRNVVSHSTSLTLSENLSSFQNLVSLQRSIDQVTEHPTMGGWTGVTQLVESLVESEQTRESNAGKEVSFEDQRSTLDNLTFETILHIFSRTYVVPAAPLTRESSPLHFRDSDGCFFKGPMVLSCGLEVVVVDTYERLWNIPSPDPLLKHRHKWRKRFATSDNRWMKSTADYAVTLWRPIVPQALECATSGVKWFCLGDVVKCGNGAPDAPMLLVSDRYDQGLLAPPVRFERVDVTGKGLPRNSKSDSDFQYKQLRSVWWPVAPPGYVALGIVAGTKEDPFKAPKVSSVRCFRKGIVKRVEALHCVWRTSSPASTSGRGTELTSTVEVNIGAQDEILGENDSSKQTLQARCTKTLPADSSQMHLLLPSADDVVVNTSLWTVTSDFCNGLLIPVVTLNHAEEASTPFALNISDDDIVMCAPVSVENALAFLEVLLHHQMLSKQSKTDMSSVELRPELPAALFALVQQLLRENRVSSEKAAVSVVRALITVVQRGAHWYDKQSLLYCRSKIITLSQDQDSGFTLHALLQAFVELMLAVEDQQRSSRVQELAACLERDDGNSLSLPYRFHFSKQPFVETVASHSSKITVSRDLSSGEEQKFLLDYQAEDGKSAAAREAIAVERLGVSTGGVYSCRFEHTPALVMTMRDEIKAEIVYFEVTIVEWRTCASVGGLFSLGFALPSFPLERVLVGGSADGLRSYSFTPENGQVLCTGDTEVDSWRWVEPAGGVTSGDVFGCGLRLDTQEMFFCKNGQMLGTAFSSISSPQQLHPTISFDTKCKLLTNLGSLSTTSAKDANFSFSFHSLDCDNLMSAFKWFEPLSQVYGVMKSLIDPCRPDKVDVDTAPTEESSETAQLPDEFLLSADNFLSDISEDVCTRIESAHPYDLNLQESLVSFPLATSICLRLAVQSKTASSHCLQILQGGSTSASGGRADGVMGGSGEAEVQAFTGACGGQEVTIAGNSFVWRFPVQSNFQCRVDRMHKGPYLKLDSRDKRLSLVRDKGWQVAIGVARCDSGVYIWEVRISFVTASSNIFLGIARRDVRMDSYLGKDNRGWGWIGNRALWHNGSKQRGAYGDKFKTGDIVRLTLNLRRGTLSYALNGKDLGVAFGPGGTGPKLEGTFYPGFALYNQRDLIDLIGGHRVEDGGPEPELPRTGSGLASEDDSYYSEEEEDLDLQSFSEDDVRLGDGAIPNFRMDLAITLSQMGFPMESCLYALRHCEDDAEQATDYILANMHTIDALAREETEVVACCARYRQLLQERALSRSENLDEDLLNSTPAPSLSPVEGDVTVVQNVEDVTSVKVSTLSQNQSHQSPRSNEWGIAFTAVPELSITGRRLLANKFGSRLRQLHASQRLFTFERDCALVQLVNEICESRAEKLLSCDPLRMSPQEFIPTEDQIHAFPILRGIPLKALQRRFLLLRNFNCRLQTTLAFIDFSAHDEHSLLARGARKLRGVIFQHVKLAWWLGVLKEQQAPAAARPEIEVDRRRAHDALELSERGDSLASEAGERDSVFAQTFKQLHGLQPALLRGADRAFKCQFMGEFGDDFGGLYRECLAQLSSELQTFTPLLPVLRPCPNALMSAGKNRELFVPNPHLRTKSRRIEMAEFLGKLAGVAVRTKTPLDLNLPPAVWKLLVGQQVTRCDIEAINEGCFQVVDTIANLDVYGVTDAMFEEIVDASFTVLSSARETVELVPGGRHLHVTWDDREEYARAVETYRFTEFAPVCGDMIRGLATILPAPTLGLFSWHELRTLVCGKATVDIDILRRRTIYGDGCQATDQHIAYFWDVLTEFSNEQKSSFLRFVWGRSRLPTHAVDFTQNFKISGLPKSQGRADMYLPIAHTCFFSIDLPAYSCRQVMHDKLVYAITHCQSIDADNTTVAQRAGQGVNWTTAASSTAAATVSNASVNISSITGE
ncbi:unnamed protein product [Peronospora belbahrii]|uniref:B30.2/SPRY domain-containing protein n=1 Tax=Peronospora belbahrii TaxID=622444 RepID=A0AAU9LB12_9STRA|nr:unnamed protein product [Peronospora belbahrii]